MLAVELSGILLDLGGVQLLAAELQHDSARMRQVPYVA